MKKKKIELLAPAGSFGALVAGCESGADAVYLGGTRFSARASANNFSDEEITEGVKYAHIRGVKVYVTVNTLISDEELTETMEYIDFLYKIDVDALILQDIGLAKLIKEKHSDFEIHASTQMTVHDIEGALFLKEMGFARIVAARELSAEEIENLATKSGMEIEVFVHGALCVSWSGQCLMSSLIGGRSGNRGRCAQPCRRKYKRYGGGFADGESTYALSTRDLNTIEDLKTIVASGVSALKIEGRMKTPEYVSITVTNYRKALDEVFAGHSNENLEEAEYELRASFNREFTQGYILGHGGTELVSEERPDNRGIFLGKVISQKGNFLRIKLEENFVNDGDGIEIEGLDGNSGIMISGMNVNGQPGKRAKAGDTAEVYTGRTFEVGSEVRKTLDSELQKKAQDVYMEANKNKIPLKGSIKLQVGTKCSFEIEDENGNKGKAESKDLTSEATNKAATLESLKVNLEKTGDTPYEFAEITGEIIGNCFMPASVVNELRRTAIADLELKRSIWHPERIGSATANGNTAIDASENASLSANGNATIDVSENTTIREDKKVEIICRVESLNQAIICVEAGGTLIDIKWDSFLRTQGAGKAERLQSLREKGADEIWIVLPNIIKDSEKKMLTEINELCQNGSADGIVANGIGMVHWARENGVSYRAGSSLNIFNKESLQAFADSKGIQPSEELTFTQIVELGKHCDSEIECKVYGQTVVMTLEYCPFETEGCHTDCGILKGASLDDNTGRAFPLRRSLGHRIQLLNSSSMLVYKELASFEKNGLVKYILDFTNETKDLIEDIVTSYISEDLRKANEYPDMILESMESGETEYTKGHYFRGVI